TNLRDSLKQYQATLVKKDLDLVEKMFSKATEAIAKANSGIEEHKAKQAKLYERLNEVQKKADELGKKIFEEADKKQAGIRREIEETKSHAAALEERIRQLNENFQNNLRKIENISKEVSEIGNAVKDKEKEADLMSSEEDDLLKRLHEKQRELEAFLKKTGISKDLEKTLKEAEEINSKIESIKEKIGKISSEEAVNSEKIALKKAALEAKRREAEEFKKRESSYAEKIKQFQEKIKSAEKEICELEKQSEKYLSLEKDDNFRLEKTERELFSARQRHSNLSGKISAVKSISGMSEAAEAVIEASKKKQLNGIIGTVGSLCKYDQEYSVAVETAAGQKMFYIVTETANDAAEAVKFIKRNQLGRASFIPLDKIKPVKIDKKAEQLSSHKDSFGFAVNLVKYDKRLEPVFQFVFGDTLVVKDIDTVKDIGVGAIRMVTKDGDLAEFSGLITGGYYKKAVTQNDLNTLAELENTIKELESAKDSITANLRSTREKISELREKRSKAELSLKENDVLLKEAEARVKEFSSRESFAGEFEKEIKEMESRALSLSAAREELEKQLAKLLSERAALKIDFKDAESGADGLSKLQNEVQSLKDALNELKLKRSVATSEIEKVMLKKRKDKEDEIKKIEKENKEISERIKKATEERNETLRKLKEKEDAARKAATSMTDMYAEKEKLENERHELASKAGELTREIDRLKEDLSLNQIEKAKVETQYHDLKRQWEKLKDVPLLDITRKALEEKIEETQKQLDVIGEVNMKAIDMFKEMSEEVAEIAEKKKKLLAERESIIFMINDVESKKYAVFMETFNALNENFNKYFKELYPEEGSEAHLSLENPEKPFEGGLVLTAKSSSRPIKTIDLLSGGEKTLAAIAFIFAVQAYKPSPFYVLDEVDAALDDENSNRIASMIKKASSDLQFIIVTHNPLITRKADQIIGVHMGKDGSSLVEVDLKSYTLGNAAKN
ncbi:MAG: AAA family ATPase, partial [archaeon]